MRIAIVNDMKLACEALRRAVSATPPHSVAWIATDGQQAIDLTQRDRPDLILMDLIMPGVDGAEATRRIMAETPCPILVVTSTVSGNFSKVYEAMGHGALDAVETPTLGPKGDLLGAASLLEKIARIGHLDDTRTGLSSGFFATAVKSSKATAAVPPLVLFGASTGGPNVLALLLKQLPADLPAPVIIAQHVDEAYAGGLAKWLGTESALPVEIATTGAEPRVGRIYLAASDADLVLGRDRRFKYERESQSWYRPSVDALFLSAARNCPTPGAAALLTGMGRDGAAGLLALRQLNWHTVAQDKATSVVWGMPKAAIDLGAAKLTLSIGEIVPSVVSSIRRASFHPSSPSR
jgi:two-component system response regulator WspF